MEAKKKIRRTVRRRAAVRPRLLFTLQTAEIKYVYAFHELINARVLESSPLHERSARESPLWNVLLTCRRRLSGARAPLPRGDCAEPLSAHSLSNSRSERVVVN
ncbi:hypothetical protein EVAR_26675_1 [Eumeta japonica]|uniref:Uncharacterized protein n=1 Tax=Eumeta variegata TaxID=151549 RepID=A0A4C1VLS2_EUMVA|nr:hypothetical protein EVAR_26675_1 [Eumeta japonica]